MANTPSPHPAPVPFRAFFAKTAGKAEAQMENQSAPVESLRPNRVYMAAAICLVLGLAIGYVSRGFESLPLAGAAPPAPVSRSPHASDPRVAGLDEMKQMADAQAAPLLDKLATHPEDSAVLAELGAIYHRHHQFRQAAAYFQKAVQADAKNIPLRNRLASSLYRSGDADGAIAQLNQALTYDRRDANSLFNLGMIRLQAKGDGEGALAAWQRLLKSNPQLSAESKAEVQKLMADVLTSTDEPRGKRAAGK